MLHNQDYRIIERIPLYISTICVTKAWKYLSYCFAFQYFGVNKTINQTLIIDNIHLDSVQG